MKPRVIEDYKNETVDRNIFLEMGNMGIFGPTINDYGCLGESYKTYGLIAKEIESIDSGYRSMFSVQSSLVMNPIYKYGSDIVKDKYLVEFENSSQSLTEVTKKLISRLGYNWKQVRGPAYWLYEDETLVERRLRMEIDD